MYLNWRLLIESLLASFLVTAAAENSGKGMTVIPQANKRVIENGVARFAFDAAQGTWELTDLRVGKSWRSSAKAAALPQIRKVEQAPKDDVLNVSMDTAAGPAQSEIRLEGSEVLVTIKPSGQGKYSPMVFPAPILPSSGAQIVLPVDEGALLPASGGPVPPRVTGTYQYAQSGLLMPWLGVLDGDAGVMVLLETTFDWQGEIRESAESGASVRVPFCAWLPSRDGLRYERRLRLCLFDKGGYVAMAKRYRKFLTDNGRFRTIEEKAKANSNIRKLIGAIDIYARGKEGVVLDWMIRNGVRHALYYPGGSTKEEFKKALDAGYVVGRYDIYTDVAGPELLALWGKPKDALDCRKIGFPEEPYILRDGKPKPGFAYPVGKKDGATEAGAKPTTVRCYTRCSLCQLPWMKKIIPKQIEEYGYTARFIDVETAVPPLECYSTSHPLTREEDIQTRRALFDYLRSLGQVASSEGGADWPADLIAYQEGSLTLNHLGGHIQGVYVGTAPIALPEDYVRWQFDPSIRIPLHELVYHDSLWMTWRWNHTPNRWDRRDLWDDWDLIHIVNAQMPILVIDAKGIEECGDRVLKTYRDVCGVLEKVGGVEMTEHRFLTKDRFVQESVFANGWRVIVNFSAKAPYERPGKSPIVPKSFVLERS